jgi:hypothetical protein
MSNYLRNLGRAVGFAGDNEDMVPPPAQREMDWDLISNHSESQGNINLLHQERGQQGGGGMTKGKTITTPASAPPTGEGTPPGGGSRGDPRGNLQ